ncbi:hypothetical protein HOY82DRAFT_564029, partial [Tuber indicum]
MPHFYPRSMISVLGHFWFSFWALYGSALLRYRSAFYPIPFSPGSFLFLFFFFLFLVGVRSGHDYRM